MEVNQLDDLWAKFRVKLYSFAQMIVKFFNAFERSKSQEETRNLIVNKRPAINICHDRTQRQYFSHILEKLVELSENLCPRFCTSMDPSLPNYFFINPFHQDVCSITTFKSAIDFWHRNRGMLGNEANC